MKKLDAKPRFKSAPPVRVPPIARAKKQHAAVNSVEALTQAGNVVIADRTRRGRKAGIVFGNVHGAHILNSDPAFSLAYAFRRALRSASYVRPPVKVYGPDGVTVIATIDPETRKRTPVEPT